MKMSFKARKKLAKLKERKRLATMSDNEISLAWQEKKAKETIPQVIELRDIKLRIF